MVNVNPAFSLPQLPYFTTIVFHPGETVSNERAEKIKKAFALQGIVRDWDGNPETLERGSLHLIDRIPETSRSVMETVAGFPLRLIPVAVAREMVLIDGGTWAEGTP